MWVRISFAWSLLLALIGATAIAAETKPQAEKAEQCKAYQVERGELEKSGVRAWLVKDPNDPEAGLNEEQVGKVRRLIELDEAVMFKCRLINAKAIAKVKPGAKNAKRQAALPDRQSSDPPAPPTRRPSGTGKPGQSGLNTQLVPLPVRPNNVRD